MARIAYAGVRGKAGGAAKRRGKQRLISLLITSTILGSANLYLPALAHAQQQPSGQTVHFNIPSQPLSSAINAFIGASGWEVGFTSEAVAGKRSSPVSGSMASAQALRSLLVGTGVSVDISGPSTAALIAVGDRVASAHTAPAADGSFVLDTITVNAGSGDASAADQVYETPGSVSYITGETIERFGGTNTADILNSAPGVFSGESRNSAGMDVNIRGMQGQGRVAVTVDGAQNASATYRGYQGISSTTYVDPDFIGGIAIQKGPTMGATGTGAIGGTVAMRTVSVDDIVPDGDSFGARLKIEGGTNTTSPWNEREKVYHRRSGGNGYIFQDGEMDRPGILDINAGSASVLLAARTENIDLLAGFARRISGNYHAGKNGSAAPQPVACDPAGGRSCGVNWFTPGLTIYLPGEEVLNTSQDTFSTLLKSTMRLGDDHTLDLGFSTYRNIYGESFPSGFWNNEQAREQRLPSQVEVDSYTARYNWDPESDLINLKWNAFLTDLDETNQSSTVKVSKEGRMYGADISNTSLLASSFGDLAFTYGLSYLHEETGPKAETYYDIPVREGKRQEASLFADAKWSPYDWMDLNGGVRWHDYRAQNTKPDNTDPELSDDAWDYSAGVTLKPLDGLELFGTYRNASRLPSLFEAAGGFMTTIDPNLRPEQARTWEAGVNFMRDGVFGADDAVRFKASYFDSEVSNYINRSWKRVCRFATCTWDFQYADVMYISNIEQARFAGIDLSARYENGGFSAELAGTYYNNVEFCRTLATCKNSSLAADYATNHIPPKYSASLTLSQKLLEDRLTLSTRISHIGPRAADAEPTKSGANPFIANIPWKPYTLVDVFMSYKPSDALSLNLSIENLFDTYYVNPMSLALMPSPGRTIRVGVTGDLSEGSLAGLGGLATKANYDWSGFHAGVHGQLATANIEAHDFYGNGQYPQDHWLPGISGHGFGGQAGYSHHFSNNLVLGVEGTVTALNMGGKGSLVENNRFIGTEIEWTASARMRAGFAVGNFMVYGLAGYSAARVEGRYQLWDMDRSDRALRKGWTLGGGVEYGLTKNLSLAGEYSFTSYDGGRVLAPEGATLGDGGLQISWDPKPTVDSFRLGLNYRF